jgi:hypothetical protein
MPAPSSEDFDPPVVHAMSRHTNVSGIEVVMAFNKIGQSTCTSRTESPAPSELGRLRDHNHQLAPAKRVLATGSSPLNQYLTQAFS